MRVVRLCLAGGLAVGLAAVLFASGQVEDLQRCERVVSEPVITESEGTVVSTDHDGDGQVSSETCRPMGVTDTVAVLLVIALLVSPDLVKLGVGGVFAVEVDPPLLGIGTDEVLKRLRSPEPLVRHQTVNDLAMQVHHRAGS